jgi:hypothetical protein
MSAAAWSSAPATWDLATWNPFAYVSTHLEPVVPRASFFPPQQTHPTATKGIPAVRVGPRHARAQGSAQREQVSWGWVQRRATGSVGVDTWGDSKRTE